MRRKTVEGLRPLLNKLFYLDAIYKDQNGSGQETLRAIRQSLLGACPSHSLSFDISNQSWIEFFNSYFNDRLIPHFIKIWKFLSEGDLDLIIAEDKLFLESFDEQTSSNLSRASAEIFNAREGAKGMQMLKKMSSKSPKCSFTTAFSMQCSAFNIPLLQSIIAYAFIEWACGQKSIRFSLENIGECEKLFESEFPNFTDNIGRLLSQNLGGSKLTA